MTGRGAEPRRAASSDGPRRATGRGARLLLRLRWAWLRASVRAAHAVGRLVPSRADKPDDWAQRPFSAKLRWRGRHPDPRVDYGTWVHKVHAKALVRGRLPVAALYAWVRRPGGIDASTLPPTYVMKATHGWDMSLLVRDGVVVGRNRTSEGAGRPASSAYLREVARTWFDAERELVRQARERQYALVQPGVLFEELLEPVDHEVQLFLFHGRFRIAMVFYRGFRFEGTTHRLYDASWNLLEPGDDAAAATYERTAPPAPRPPQAVFDELQRLCREIDHVRVDLYACGGRYVFGEFTFTHAAGQAGNLGRYDAEVGRWWAR